MAISPRSPAGRCASPAPRIATSTNGALRAAGRSRLGGIIAPEIAAADGIGLGQAIAERRLGGGKLLLQPLDMADRARRAAGGDVGQRRQVVFVAVGMVHQLEAHRRHADEIGDLLLLDQPQRLARVPFGHQHHAAADDEAVEHHRHFAGDVEQGHAEQGARRVGRRRGPPRSAGRAGSSARSHRHRSPVVTARWVDSAPLASPVEPEVNRIVASSSGAISGSVAPSSDAVEQAARAPSRAAARPRG